MKTLTFVMYTIYTILAICVIPIALHESCHFIMDQFDENINYDDEICFVGYKYYSNPSDYYYGKIANGWVSIKYEKSLDFNIILESLEKQEFVCYTVQYMSMILIMIIYFVSLLNELGKIRLFR